MKAHLLYETRDIDLGLELPWQGEALEQDLGLDTLLDVMAGGDPYVRLVAERLLLNGLTDPAEIRYRQDVLADLLEKPEVARELYSLAVAAQESKKEARFFLFRRLARNAAQQVASDAGAAPRCHPAAAGVRRQGEEGSARWGCATSSPRSRRSWTTSISPRLSRTCASCGSSADR